MHIVLYCKGEYVYKIMLLVDIALSKSFENSTMHIQGVSKVSGNNAFTTNYEDVSQAFLGFFL